MKYLLKKFWILILVAAMINIPLLVTCVTRTNNTLTLKGDTVEFTSVVEIDTEYQETGSFSTIYVVGMDHSTIFQNWIADLDPTIDKQPISQYYTHISAQEDTYANRIMYNGSVSKALIVAYELAKDYHEKRSLEHNINIEYNLNSFQVIYYSSTSQLRIGDKIIAVTKYDKDTNTNVKTSVDDSDEFKKQLSDLYVGNILTIERNGTIMDISLTQNDSFNATDMYTINYETISPSVKINSTNVGGPSGGLLQTLSIYNRLIEEDITHGYKIAGTGTISIMGNVGAIGGIRQKIPTALDDNVDIFFCVSQNYKDAKEAYDFLPNRNKMKLIEINTIYDALEYLEGGYKNDFKENV